MKRYSEMSFGELEQEADIWFRVVHLKGAYTPSENTRDAALREMGLVQAWMVRRSLEAGKI